MPVYLFTYHGKGTWMPDRPRGFVRRGHGILEPDSATAAMYRAKMQGDVVLFSDEQQELLVATARQAPDHIRAVAHAAFTEPTHLHVIVSWRHTRGWKSMRTSIKSALTRSLNEAYGRREWWVDSASRRRVRDLAHFDYLILDYCARHKGAKWVRPIDLERARARRNRPA